MQIHWTFLKLLVLAVLVLFRPQVNALIQNSRLGLEVLGVIMNFFVFAISTKLVVDVLSFVYKRRKKLRPGQTDNVLVGLSNIYYLILTGAILFTLLGVFGIDYKALFTSLSIVAAAIAIISKDYISEVISGIIISFSSDFSINDYVTIAGHKGKILDLHLTKVELLNEDDDVIYIPNNKVFSSETINYTKRQLKKISVEFEIDQKFLKTVEELEQDLVNSVAEYADHIVPESYNLKIVELKKDAVSFKFQYGLHQVNRELEKEIRKKTVRKVVNFIQAHQGNNNGG